MKKDLLQSNLVHFLTAVFGILIIATIGTYLLSFSHAATPYASLIVSNGTLTASAAKQTCTGTSSGSCVTFGVVTASSSCAITPPSVSNSPLYPLQHVTLFNGTTLQADNFTDYGNEIQSPAGYVAKSHAVPTLDGLLIKGYPDSVSGSVGGVTGGSGEISDSADIVDSSGGFDVCFSMSSGSWQNVHLVLIAWPNDSTWAEGENDFFEGNPQDMAINVHQIGSSPATNVWQGKWPSSLASGIHLISARWNHMNGYQFYLDNTLIATAPISSSVTTPTTPHHLAMQMQDTTESSTSTETATFYWMASYGYTQ